MPEKKVKSTHVKQSGSDRFFTGFAYVSLAVWIFLLMFPMYWLLSSAFKDDKAMRLVPPPMYARMPVEFHIDIDYSALEGKDDTEVLGAAVKSDAAIVALMGFDRYYAYGIDDVAVRGFKDGKWISEMKANRWVVVQRALHIMASNSNLNEDYIRKKDRYLLFFEKLRAPTGGKALVRMDSEKGLGQPSPVPHGADVRLEIKDKGANTEDLGAFLAARKYSGTYMEHGSRYRAASYVSRFVEPLVQKTDLPPIYHFMANSVFATGMEILLVTLISSMAAFALSRLFTGWGKKLLLMYFLVSLMVPLIATLVPSVFLAQSLNVYNTLWALILFALPNGFIIYILMGFIDALPGSYFDAARIEGASELTVFTRIAMPLSKSALSVAVLFIFLGSWNSFFWPYIVLQKPDAYTFPVAMFIIGTGVQQAPSKGFIFGVVSSLPTFVMFAFFQKQIQKGLVWSGIKG